MAFASMLDHTSLVSGQTDEPGGIVVSHQICEEWLERTEMCFQFRYGTRIGAIEMRIVGAPEYAVF